MILDLRPKYANGFITTGAAGEDVELPRGAWLLGLQPHIYHASWGADLRYEDHLYLEPGWLDPVIYVDTGREIDIIGGLRRLGYRRAPDANSFATFSTLYALQPHWTAIWLAYHLDWRRAAFWLYRHHLLGISTPPGQMVPVRDLRPNIWPFNRGCRIFGKPLS